MAFTRILSTPATYISGVLTAVIPNSVMYKIPGEANVRAVSSGGGAVDIVSGINAEKLVGEVHMEIAVTKANVTMVEKLAANRLIGQTDTITIADGDFQRAWDQVILANEPDVAMKSDGNMKLEFKGRYAF